MDTQLKVMLQKEIETLRDQGLFKEERFIESPQGVSVTVNQTELINFCANNYLGLSSHPELLEAAHEGLDERGFGMSSVRFICGTLDIHKTLERKIANFLKTEDTILYSSCFDANGGLFETIMKPGDVIISDELNHASIIDGVRLSKAARKRYRHSDMEDLEKQLKESADFRLRLIVTDGVFSMDGDLAPLDHICDLADRYDAIVMVDDSHATGFIGKKGRGTPELFGVMDRVDIVTSTLGKALGGAAGGFTSGKQYLIDYLRQVSRPYLFSNSIPPIVAKASIKAIELIDESDELRQKLHNNTVFFREEMESAGFKIQSSSHLHPIVPIMLGDAKIAKEMANALSQEGIYVVGFSYPVVPKGKARIRVQISAGHERSQIERAIHVFKKVGKQFGVI